MKKAVVILVLIIIVLGVSLYVLKKKRAEISSPAQFTTDSLTILWAKWKPADYLQELTESFTEETGIKVEVVQDSWGTWQDLFFNAMKERSSQFDMVVGDSQWLGRGATEGYYVELTRWIEKHHLTESMTEASVKGYAEYPKESGHYWAVPVEGDAMGFSYRKDLFEDPGERKAFLERYGYELHVPETWAQLRDIAEFFYRPEEDFYGVLVWCEPKYDGITMGVDALVWAWGAALGDPKTYRVRGVLNSNEGIEALKFYKELNQFNNPEWVDHYLDTDRNSNQPMMDGKVAMAMGYFAINPELLDPEKNPYADNMGFFACPEGPKTCAASLGGQGISIISYTKNKEASFEFLDWFVRDDTQKKWAELGGLSCNKSVLYSDEFAAVSPLNAPFVKSMEMVRDFWAIPEYTEFLSISQKYWYDYVVAGNITADEAMNNIAREWEDIFEAKGYYSE